jgi:hypothetical protein
MGQMAKKIQKVDSPFIICDLFPNLGISFQFCPDAFAVAIYLVLLPNTKAYLFVRFACKLLNMYNLNMRNLEMFNRC